MNTRQTCLPVIAVAVLTACSSPYDTVLPSDPDQWSSSALGVQTLKLPREERELLMSYMVRAAANAEFYDDPIPEGITIGKAIEAERNSSPGRRRKAAETR